MAVVLTTEEKLEQFQDRRGLKSLEAAQTTLETMTKTDQDRELAEITQLTLGQKLRRLREQRGVDLLIDLLLEELPEGWLKSYSGTNIDGVRVRYR
jgi:hypothetical protein